MANYRLGAKPDKEDRRDYHLPSIHQLHLGIGAPLPAKASARHGLNLPPFDQGELGSCTGNAGAQFARWTAQKYRDFDFVPSRLWLYYQERKMEGGVVGTEEDAGAQSRSIFKVLAGMGVPSEEDDPYQVDNFAASTHDDFYLRESATSNRIGAYHRLGSVEVMKACITSQYAFCLGIPVYPSFWELEGGGKGGVIRVPQPTRERPEGGHEIFGVEFDEGIPCSNGSQGAVRIINSWGEGWAEGGEAWLPFDYFRVVGGQGWDAWMGHLGRPWK